MKEITSKIAYFCVGICDLANEKLGPLVRKIIERGEKKHKQIQIKKVLREKKLQRNDISARLWFEKIHHNCF